MLFGVFEEELDDEDKGSVNVLDQALLIRLLDGGEWDCVLSSKDVMSVTLKQTLGLRS